MKTMLKMAYDLGAKAAMEEFEKNAFNLLGGIRPSTADTVGSLLLGAGGGAVAAPYLDEEGYEDDTNFGKFVRRFQGGLLGASGAMTGSNRFGALGALGGLGSSIGANYGLTSLSPEGDSTAAGAGRAAIEGLKTSIGSSLLANSLFRGAGLRNIIDSKMRKVTDDYGVGQAAKIPVDVPDYKLKSLRGDPGSYSISELDYGVLGLPAVPRKPGTDVDDILDYKLDDYVPLGGKPEDLAAYKARVAAMSKEEMNRLFTNARAKEIGDTLYDGFYRDFMMGPVDEGGPGSFMSKLTGSKPGAVSKAFDYWLGSPEIAQLVKKYNNMYEVPAAELASAMGKDIGIGAGVGLLAAVPGAAYTAIDNQINPEPWYNKMLPGYKIVPKD